MRPALASAALTYSLGHDLCGPLYGLFSYRIQYFDRARPSSHPYSEIIVIVFLCRMTSPWVPRPLTSECKVCSAPAPAILHYGSISCYSCRAFFRRSIRRSGKDPVCVRGRGECEVDPVTRTNCKSCRLARCRKAGMDDARVDRVERKLGRLKQAKSKPATQYVLAARER